MSKPEITVRIPEPCHQDWNTMTPDLQGRYCGSCCKSVIDFTNKTDAEIRNILMNSNAEKLCGRFKKTQIDRPLKLRFNLNKLPRCMSLSRAFAIAVFFVFGTMLFSCTDYQGKKVEGIEFTREDNDAQATIGMIVSEYMVNETTAGHADTLNEMIGADEGGILGDVVIEMNEMGEAMVETQIPDQSGPGKDGCAKQDSIAGKAEQMKQGEMKDSIPLINHDEFIFESVGVLESISNETVLMEDEDNVILPDSALSRTLVTGAGENEREEEPRLSVYPNPGTGEFTIRHELFGKAPAVIVLYDERGSLIKTLADSPDMYEGNGHLKLNLKDVPDGIYYLCLTVDGKLFTNKLIVARQ